MSGMTIGRLARQGGGGVETVRYYQRRALMRTPRSDGVRTYDEVDLARLRFIRSAQAAGFTLEQIGELLALDECDDRARARELALERIAALDLRIAQLSEARAALQRLARQCAETSDGPCPILGAFER